MAASCIAVASIHTTTLAGGAAVGAEIEKSPNDDREYRHLTLENGLKVTLIHDSKADMAAAAMDVAVGAGRDPEGRPGLAHFLEHMLFLGTEKYPDPGAYAAFVQQHGGSKNAYTTFANTNYFFEIEASQLKMALDRFAQFFIAPLFSEDLVQREKNAVHSEFSGKRREESLRFWSARKQGFNPGHPMTGFTTGNLETLADRPGSDIRQELIDFYDQHYSSNIMSLAVSGRQSLDQLQHWVEAIFSDIKNRNAKRQNFDIPLYTEAQLGRRIDVTPLTEQRFLVISFPVPKVPHHRFSRPRSYVGNVLGHEGPGSLLSELKRHGWVVDISAGGSTETRNSTTFDVSIGLSEVGVNHIAEIVHAVFAAVNRLRQSGLPRWLYEENQLISELAFRYQEKASPARMVRSLSVRAQDWPAEKLLSGPYRKSHFDTEGIRLILDHLRPENMQMTVVAPGLDTTKTTAWYDTPYSINTFPEALVSEWKNAGLNPNILMPEPNPFLPDDLSLRADGVGDPVRLIDTPKLQVWHRTDSSFGVPRATFKASIELPVTLESVRNRMLTDIYARMVNEQLNEFSYAANLAGLGAGLSSNSRGLSINMAGYADGQQDMLQSIVDVMADPEPDETVFQQIRRDLQEQIINETQDAPYKQTAARTYQLLYTPYFSDKARLEVLENLTLDDLLEFLPEIYDELRIVILSHGNLTGTETLALVEIIRRDLIRDARPAVAGKTQMVKLPEGARYHESMVLDHADSSISMYFQSLARDRASRARYAVLRQILSQPLYTELRTRQQLGYFVFTYSIDLIQVPSVVIALQSPSTGPGKLYAAVEKFLTDFETVLQNMSDEEFVRNVEAVLAQVEEQDNRLRRRTNRYWSAIIREDYRFDASVLFAEELRRISKQQIVDLYNQLFIKKQNGQLLVTAKGQALAPESDIKLPPMQVIDSPAEFKSDKVRLPPLSDVPGVE